MKEPIPGDNTFMKRYVDLLAEIKTRIRQAHHRAMMSANEEMLHMYWDIGRMITARQDAEGWGAAVVPRIAVDLRRDVPDRKGFSERNIGRMIAFFRAYPDLRRILPQPVAKSNKVQKQGLADLPQPVAKIRLDESMASLPQAVPKVPWGHNILLMEKVKNLSAHLERFLLELGAGFAFVGRQVHRHKTDNPTIGLILCQDKKRVLAEYALRGMNKPIGISEYELTRALPEELKSALPTIEEIEAELSADLQE